uniref:Metalloendopeptidase n=1 Tax=Parastrongyloides trichosuri TaxID=131310 RepID=A0A0N4ZDK0_PARTI
MIFNIVIVFLNLYTASARTGDVSILRPDLKWTQSIEYYIDKDWIPFSQFLKKAIKNIEDKTCIQFKESKYEIRGRQGINFLNKARTEAFNIGPLGIQLTNLVGINYHEDFAKTGFIQSVIHITLGAVPESTRCDRDKYITIQYQNIKDNYKKDFDLKNYTCHLVNNISYDYGSVTHHYQYDFSTDSGHKKVLYSNEFSSYFQHTMGQIDHATFNDYKTLNALLCSDKCRDKKNKCHHGGYLNPKNCDQCLCPYGLQGDTCEDAVSIYQYINIFVSGYYSPEHLTAQSWSQYFNEYRDRNRYIYVHAPNYNQKIWLRIKYVRNCDFYTTCLPGRGHEIRYRADKGVMGVCLCGWYDNHFNVVSENNLIIIYFHGRCYRHGLGFDYQLLGDRTDIKNDL